MPHPRFTSDEIGHRGEQLYEQGIRATVEADEANIGKMIAIDIETGDYEIDQSGLIASERLQARHPGAALYGTRIGYDAVVGFGVAPRRTKQ